MRQELARCPVCPKPVSGGDLLMWGRRPHCGRALTSLLAPTRAGLDRDEWIALLGALGVLAGLAAADAGEPAHDVGGVNSSDTDRAVRLVGWSLYRKQRG
jgi:hypothetical protein